jgi:hypothetical protein
MGFLKWFWLRDLFFVWFMKRLKLVKFRDLLVKVSGKSLVLGMVFTGVQALTVLVVRAQDGEAGIREATDKVKSYFSSGCDLMYAIGAVVGIIGAIKVYNKWNAGEPDTSKVASAWFGSCIFLVVVATVLESFFGL